MRPSATDTLRHQLIASLEKRSADQPTPVRAVLEEKRAHLHTPQSAPPKGVRVVPTKGVRVVAASERPEAGSLSRLTQDLSDAAASRSPARRDAYPELPALDDFQAIWSALRTESQWRQSLVDAPENAGPLNSSALVHRAIALMRELSPGYLQHFLAYVDDLSWLGQIGDDAPTAGTTVPRPTSPGKRVRKKVPKSKA